MLEPSEAGDAELVGARVGGREVAASGELRGDSLLVSLPPPVVRRDSVEVVFRTRLFESPTVFEAFVLNSSEQDNTQGVVGADRGLDQGFVPGVVEAVSLFQQVVYGKTVTPNGDGGNDVWELSFNLVKTDRAPRVRIYALVGSLVAELVNAAPQAGPHRYLWDGRDAAAQRGPAGPWEPMIRKAD